MSIYFKIRTRDDVATLMARLRRRRGITQLSLAARIGVSRTAVSHIERGNHALSVESLMRTLDALGYELIVVPKQVAITTDSD